MLRGRHRKHADLERDILLMLKESRAEIGFRELFSRLEGGSKSTLSSTLKLLQSQNKINKNKDRKYVLSPKILLFSDVRGLKRLLDNLDELIPNLKPDQKAFIGIKLWTVIFQNEFHPATMFMSDSPYFRISNSASRPTREKAIQDFFESRNHPSMFEDEMYQLFFKFCAKCSSLVLDEVFGEILNFEDHKLRSTYKGVDSLAKSFHKEIWVTNDLTTNYYGIPFYKILLEKRPDACNENTLQRLKEKNMFQKIKIME